MKRPQLVKKCRQLELRFFCIAIVLLISFSVNGQKSSLPERMVKEGYAMRFTDTTACVRIQMSALELARKSGSREDEVICYVHLALTHRRMLHLKEFMQYAGLAEEAAATTTSIRAKAYAAFVTGSLNSYIENRSGAIEHMLKAWELFVRLQDYEKCAIVGADISYLFSPGSMATEKKYADEALKYAIKAGNPESLLHARLAVGSYLVSEFESDRDKWPGVLSFLKQTVSIAEENEYKIVSKSNIAVAYINLAVLYMEGPSPMDERAFLVCLDKATLIAKQYSLRNVYHSSIGLRAHFFMQKGALDIAESLLKEGIAYQQSLPYRDYHILSGFGSSLKQLAVLQKDYAAYYGYDTLFSRYNKLQYDEAAQQAVQNADARFESEKKASRIRQLEQENELQKKNKLLGYGIAVVLFAGLVFMYRSYYFRQRYYQNREDILRQQQANHALKLELMEKETMENLAEKLSLERRLLRSQMNPHFIFNTLGNIQGIILQSNPSLAVNYLGKFAKLTRKVLEQSRMETIRLSEEIDTLQYYIELQQLRLNNSFDYHLVCDDAIDMEVLLPPLLIQPFVENAVEHGLKPLSSRKGILTITFNEDVMKKLLICVITDNGIGLKESMQRKTGSAHSSLSSIITDERLSLMLKDNPYSGFTMEERNDIAGEQGCITTLHIPIS